MTTPKSGREAFEAWYAANDNTRKSIERDATGYRLIQTESAWQAWDAAWQAALAQQGREVGEAVAWIDEYGLLLLERGMPALVSTKRRDACTPLYTSAQKQQAVEVTEEMVEKAHAAYGNACLLGAPSTRVAMKCALLAALPGKTEVE